MNKVLNKNNKLEGGLSLPSIIIIVLIVLILLFIFNRRVLVLSARSYPDNELLSYFEINNDSYIGIEYTHSVERTETSEWYRIGNNNLVLMEERFKSQGAGLPATSPYKYEKYDEGFRLYDINKEFDNVIYRTGQVIANHQLIIDGNYIDFKEFSDPGQGVLFDVEEISYLEKLKMGVF